MSLAGISGAGVISALGRNTEETRTALFAEDPVLPQPTRRLETKLKLPVFEIPVPEGHEELGLPLRFLLAAVSEALKNATLTPEMLKSRKVGIAIGTTVACQLDNIPCQARLRQGDLSGLSPIITYISGMPAEYLRRFLDLDGPALTISNACASGADAAMIGLEWLRTGRCDLVIAAGCDSVSKVAFNGFNALRVCSPAPCRPFDSKRAGLNLGDAAGAVILEAPEKAAERGIIQQFELAGAGKTADAFHITQPESSGLQLERAIALALREAGLKPNEIDFVNAHGTGTLVNDRVESAILAKVFGPAVRFQLQEKRAAASCRYESPSDEIPVAPLAKPVEIPGNAALSTSLAFGGSNTALVLRKIGNNNSDRPLGEMFIAAFSCLVNGGPDRDELVRLCRKYGLRRPDRLTQLALTCADAVADRLNPEQETALITVTSYGPATTTCKVVYDILDYPEEEILPTGFSHSVINAASSYIGASLKIHGPTFAIAGFEDPFYEAADLARVLLSSGKCAQVLIVAADEKGVTSEAAETLRRSSNPLYREGAFALLLTADIAENRFGKIELAGSAAGERLLSCGIPAELPDKIKNSASGKTIELFRLPASDWAI